MQRYICLVKEVRESMIGIDIKLKARMFDKMEDLEKWAKRFNKKDVMVLHNTEEFNKFFEIFECVL